MNITSHLLPLLQYCDVHNERVATNENLENHILELMAQKGTSTQPQPKNLNLTVPIQSNLCVSTHSETLDNV